MEDIIYWIWLSILNLSPIEKIKLLEIFKNPKKIYRMTKKELIKYTNSNRLISTITDKSKRIELNQIINEAIRTNTKIITCQNQKYSKQLKQIYDYPVVLFAKGNLELLNKKSIAIVGTRNCSEYGKNIARRFGYLLAREEICIVSGMAKGIDSYAHKGAIIAKGKTIAVLGSGINNIYPAENTKLYNAILNNDGLIISEYGIDTPAFPENFPKRNRIISGLSEKVLVVEAIKNSGSIITANLAAEQGKSVYAIPGNILSDKSVGTNELIKDGAILVTSIEDITNL